ncbi:MAG: DUF5110 domain-containing protein [Kiritimatiellae bacterium]|nr:DUF5110 domain-containing protein [Kiritimatiellia bacterium]
MLQWTQLHNGVWSARIGPAPEPDLLKAAGVAPQAEALAALPAAPFPFEPGAVTVAESGDRVVASVPVDPAETLYGLGLNFTSLEIQRSVRHLHVDHFGGKDNGRTHAPVPFYVSGKGYGLFVNVARYVSVYAGVTHRREAHPPVVDRNTSPEWRAVQPGRTVDFVMPAAGFEILVFAGPTPLLAVQRFNLYCGGGCLPPKWGLGFWHRVPTRYTAEQVGKEIAEFDAQGFPLDVVGLEPGWHSASYPTTYEWSAERFPDPAGFVGVLLAAGIRVNLWENPFVAPDSPLARELGARCGTHTGGWGGLVPDLLLPEARAIMAAQHEREHVALGVSGYKLDECDGIDPWLWPDHAEFPSGATGEEIRQVYGVLYQRMTTELFRKRNLRTYGLVRASNAGAVSMPYVLYNDSYSHEQFITALCSAGFCGLLWTPEVRGSKTAEEWLRRMQAVCFSPMAMINAWASGTKPWTFAAVAEPVREAMRLRMRLIPYLYSAFARYRFEGIPPFRAMALEPGFHAATGDAGQGELDDTENPYSIAERHDVKDQFMMGDSLLVAPLFAGQAGRDVVLPAGKWYDFHSGECVGAGTVRVTAEPARIPLFVRDGGLIPLMPACERVPPPEARVVLEVRHYGERDGTFRLYDDDGTSHDYERGAYCWWQLEARLADGRLEGTAAPLGPHEPFAYERMTWRQMNGQHG